MDAITNYTGKQDYQFGDITVATTKKAWFCLSKLSQSALIKATGSPHPALQLISMINTLRDRNDLPQLTIESGRGLELLETIKRISTPAECVLFTRLMWSSGIDDDQEDRPELDKFNVLIPYITQ